MRTFNKYIAIMGKCNNAPKEFENVHTHIMDIVKKYNLGLTNISRDIEEKEHIVFATTLFFNGEDNVALQIISELESKMHIVSSNSGHIE